MNGKSVFVDAFTIPDQELKNAIQKVNRKKDTVRTGQDRK